MKLNNATKTAITAVIAILVVELWRNFPWIKKAFIKADGMKGNFFDQE